MIKILAVLVLIGVAFADPIPTLARGRITIEELPYHVGILNRDHVDCNGIILSKDWILTAGRCVDSAISLRSVRAGSANSTWGGSIHKISRVIRHENYGEYLTSGHTTHDIALIRVATPLTIDATRQPIGLYKSGEGTRDGSAAVISGFTWMYGSAKEFFLLTRDVTIISKEQCKKAYYLGHEEASQLCADNVQNEKENFCQHSVGAALTVNGRVAGIVIDGTQCLHNSRPRPLIYTDVGFFRDWIKEHSGL